MQERMGPSLLLLRISSANLSKKLATEGSLTEKTDSRLSEFWERGEVLPGWLVHGHFCYRS